MITLDKSQLVHSLKALWKEAFRDSDKFIDTFFTTAFSPERLHFITVGSDLAAALYWFDCSLCGKKAAYIYAVATAKKFRNQGLCRRLLNETHTRLETLGYTYAILVPSSNSLFTFYEKSGYKTHGYVDEFECSAAEISTDIKPLIKQEYALLRQKYLSPRGVIQENENLEFLKTQAKFYKGKDFLLAARTEKGRLFGIELLGNKARAPEILTALNCKKGKFRTIGSSRPFAMCYSLSGTAVPDNIHFDLAFD